MIGRIKRHKKIAAVVMLCLCAAGVAAAAWLVNGSGTGRAGFGSLTAPTVTVGTLGAGTQCFPGADCAGYFTVNNPNTSSLVLTGSSGAGGATGTPTTGGCTFDNVTVNQVTGLTIAIPPGSTNVTVPGVFHAKTTTPTACQNQNVTLDNVTLTFSTP